jgi:hypothetical protein
VVRDVTSLWWGKCWSVKGVAGGGCLVVEDEWDEWDECVRMMDLMSA